MTAPQIASRAAQPYFGSARLLQKAFGRSPVTVSRSTWRRECRLRARLATSWERAAQRPATIAFGRARCPADENEVAYGSDTPRGIELACALERFEVGPVDEEDFTKWRTEFAYLIRPRT